jgi:mRNA interferase YafQ
MTERSLRRTAQFKKDYKRLIKRGYDKQKLFDIFALLLSGEPLPKEYLDHPLSGKYNGCNDCHLDFDWVLIYVPENELGEIKLVRTGTHADIF